MTEFTRTISSGEASKYYLNLSNDQGHTFGSELDLPHRTKILVVDGRGRLTYAQMHNTNQLWGGRLRNWFIDNEVVAGRQVLVRFDSNRQIEGIPAILLVPQ